MSIDLCIVTTLRPEILEKTLSSFLKNILFSGDFTVVYNLDLAPVDKQICKNIFKIGHSIGVISKIFGNQSGGTIGGKPNFAKAVKAVWSNSTADYVFMLEDDWAFLREINLNKCIERMEKENFDYMRFPKVNAPHLNCLHKVALQPSLWKGDVVRNLAKHMVIDKDSEKQLRTGQGNDELDKILIELQDKGLKDYCTEWCCKDIGREWREERGLIKWNKNKGNKDITWSTNE